MASPLSSILRARFTFTITTPVCKVRFSPTFISLPRTLIRNPSLKTLSTSAVPEDSQRSNPQPQNQWTPRNNDFGNPRNNLQHQGFDGGYGNRGVNQGYQNHGNLNSGDGGAYPNPNFPSQGLQPQNQNYPPSRGNANQWSSNQNQNYPPPNGNANQWSNTQNQGYVPNSSPNYPPQGGFQNQAYPQNPNQSQNYPRGGVDQWKNNYNQNFNPSQPQQQNQNQNQNQRGGSYGPAVVNNQVENRGPAMTDQAPSANSVSHLLNLCREGKVKEALEHMGQEVRANAECFSLPFQLCGNSKKFEDAKKVHDYFLRSPFRGYIQLNNKVLEMYSKCGSMTDARRVFDHMPDRNMDSWHLMINGYAANGLGDDGLTLFEQMRQMGLPPTGETFLAVLDACASAEAFEEAFIHFESMKTDYGISPGIEHYLGLLGVFGKSGHLAEAEEYIESLPFEPTAVSWEALMNFARIHGDIDLEDHAEELMASLDPSKAITNKILQWPVLENKKALNFISRRNIKYIKF